MNRAAFFGASVPQLLALGPGARGVPRTLPDIEKGVALCLSAEERLAHNQTLFREVNERIQDLGNPAGATEFLCECSDQVCIAPIELTFGEYERVRSDSTWFLVKPGHQIAEIERVVSEDERFLVVEKVMAQDDLEATDPRASG